MVSCRPQRLLRPGLTPLRTARPAQPGRKAAGTAQFAPTGDKLNASGKQNTGPIRNVGKVNGPTRAGVALVALAQSLPGYEAAASKAASVLDVPASQRAIVQAYFDGLAEAQAGGQTVPDSTVPAAPPTDPTVRPTATLAVPDKTVG